MTIHLWPDYKQRVAYSPEKAHKVVLAETENSRSTLWCLQPGQHIHPHVHAGDHIWVVLEGKGMFLSEGTPPQPITAGTMLVAPAGTSHGVDNTGPSGLVFLSVSA